MLCGQRVVVAEVDLDRLRSDIIELASPVVADNGAELVDVDVSGKGTYSVRILVYRAQGVDLVLCTAIAREVSDLFDVEDPIPGRYRLEVTSPGLDRPLQTDDDFRRAQSRMVKVVTRQGRTELGRLVEFTSDSIVLAPSGSKDSGGSNKDVATKSVDRDDIAKATVEVEF